MAIGTTIFGKLELGNGNLLPEVKESDRFPYCEETGKACFLCENEPCNRHTKEYSESMISQ